MIFLTDSTSAVTFSKAGISFQDPTLDYKLRILFTGNEQTGVELTCLDRKVVDKVFQELKKENLIVSPVRCKWEPVNK